MIIYNVTIKISADIETEWLEWMKHEHLPEMMSTGCFLRHQLVKLLDMDDTEGPTYAAQYYAESREQYDLYIQAHSARLRQQGLARWGDRFIAFRSLMAVVN